MSIGTPGTTDTRTEDELIDLLTDIGISGLSGELRYKYRATVRDALEPLEAHMSGTMQEAINRVKESILSLRELPPRIEDLYEYIQQIISDEEDTDSSAKGGINELFDDRGI